MSDFRIEKLDRIHPVESFDCGQPALNDFLCRFALTNQQANASQTWVGLHGETVIGFYTLVVGSVGHEDAPERISKGLARHPIPLMVLARLATDVRWQGKGIGSGLLRDAILRTLNAAEIAGIRALAVHAKDDHARNFYKHFDFIPSPTDPFHMFVLLKDLRRYR